MKCSVVRCLVIIGMFWLVQSQAVALTQWGTSAGAAAADCSLHAVAGADAFSTLGVDFSTTQQAPDTAVPVPAAAWIFGSGLLCLAGGCRRRKAD